jgi:primary-amine oxidase
VPSEHPLDPLTAAEIELATTLLRDARIVRLGGRIVSLELSEPTKDELEAFAAGARVTRRARAVVRDATGRPTREITISLTRAVVEGVVERPGIQPAITAGEYATCREMLRTHDGFRAALGLRGVEDMELVTIEAWGVGDFVLPEDEGRRLVWCPSWVRRHPGDNPYARPIDGVFAIVDLDTFEVVRIEDHGVLPLPEEDGNYTPAAVGPMRGDVLALDIVQPDGPSFAVDGWHVTWQKWSLRLGFTPREGLVLHTVAYDDRDRRRPILHRASFSELFVPYGDPGPGSYRRNAFDMGEYGLGALTNSLELGCDCLGEIRYFDVTLADDAGAPYTIANAICLHEEDFGLLWKHTDVETGHVEVRRSRRLVISSIVTADNYEYAFYWYLYQDGSIECEVKLTGIVLTSGIADGAQPRFARRLGPRLSAPNHQHFFNVRLDLDVDGRENTVYEVHTEPAPPEENPYGNAFHGVRTALRMESDARHDVDPAVSRFWRIENPTSRNGLGEPVAYRVVPGGNVAAFAQPGSSVRRRAGFVDRHLWVTPHDPRERYASGEYPNQTSADTGLAEWVKQDRPIESRDVVVWYTFGCNHLPRPEDWPVMPVERVGFVLKPDGFFDRNPALDVPAVAHSSCHHATTTAVAAP